MNLTTNHSKTGLAVVAHDDDAILALAGIIVRHLTSGGKIFVVVCTDGRHSHEAVLGIKENPNAWEVKAAREKEMRQAMKTLGLPEKNLVFLQLTDGDGRVWQNELSTKNQLLALWRDIKPDVIYFHHPDAHPDHKGVSKVVLEILKDLEPGPEAYQFFIWTPELAQGRPEVDPEGVPAVPPDALKITLKPEELRLKRDALYAMKSQVEIQPYPGWLPQRQPILDRGFIDNFLRGEETFVKILPAA